MGAGDWLMATAQVKELHARTGKRVRVVNSKGITQWNEVFLHNPKIVRPDEPSSPGVRLTNASGARPYIAAKLPDRWIWKRWATAPGEIYLSRDELAFGEKHGGGVLVEPHTKVAGSNKAWPFDRWQEFARTRDDLVQVGKADSQRLDGVRFVETPSFRHACAVLSASRGFVGTEGGLHHAAAALGIRGVVLFSAFISPDVTGYPGHINIYKGAPGLGCGSRNRCQCCLDAMERITVEEVVRNVKEMVRETR